MRIYILVLLFLHCFLLNAQTKQVKGACIGFYNLENLYDTENDPTIDDEEFLPNGKKNYNLEMYHDKLDHLADVISRLGKDFTPDGLAILGVAEIENKKVLEDLIIRPKLADRNWGIVHYNSPDVRGVDVGLIYQTKYFTPVFSKPIGMNQKDSKGKERKTRDILYVKGVLDGDTMHILVNHWPSRRGGAAATEPYRKDCARVCREFSDSLFNIDPLTKILIMGDLNDDPSSPSLKEVLMAKEKKEDVVESQLYNPLYKFFKAGIGTLAYDDSWNLFDNIVISYGVIQSKKAGYHYYKARVYNEPFMQEKSGAYKSYPKRTFIGDTYNGGYSDHFPVYLTLIKEVK
ncbi:MAG: hypothetical protein ACOYOA_12870 [Saprospiraceae bacterium]